MNPNYIFKDGLQYKIFIRGIRSDVEVQTLRKLLRSAVTENVAVKLSALSRKDISELFQIVLYKVAELRTIVGSEQSDKASLVTRVRTRISHVKDRLRHLIILNGTTADLQIADLQQQQDLLADLEAELDKMEAAQGSSQKGGEWALNKHASQEEAVLQAADTSGAARTQPHAEGESAVNNEPYAMTMMGIPQRDTTAQLGTQVFKPHLYQRLPLALCRGI
jgi:hypothetical protein